MSYNVIMGLRPTLPAPNSVPHFKRHHIINPRTPPFPPLRPPCAISLVSALREPIIHNPKKQIIKEHGAL